MSRPTVSRFAATIPATAARSSTTIGHRADEDELVGAAELPDRPLLERGRRQVDDRRAHREHGRGGGHGEGGDEVGGREAHDGGEHAVRRMAEGACSRGRGCGLHGSCSEPGERRDGWCGRMTAMTDAAHHSSPELVHYAVHEAVATLTLDSPANRNALSRQLVTELFAHLERAGADTEVRVVLIESSGKVFCSGADLTEATSEGMEAGTRRIVDLQRLITTLDKPVVTKNLGAVRAGGIGIIAAADIAISAEEATFALTEVKLGLAAAIISLTVHHRMNPRAAALTTLGGEVFSGAEAAAYGLVTKAVPADRARRRGGGDLRQPRDRCPAGAARVEADPQPRPRRAHRRARRGDGHHEHAALRQRRGARGDDGVPVEEVAAPPASVRGSATEKQSDSRRRRRRAPWTSQPGPETAVSSIGRAHRGRRRERCPRRRCSSPSSPREGHACSSSVATPTGWRPSAPACRSWPSWVTRAPATPSSRPRASTSAGSTDWSTPPVWSPSARSSTPRTRSSRSCS